MQLGRIAYFAARRRCEQAGVSFLDDSVVVKRLYPKIGAPQGVALVRLYGFEFSTVGDVRYSGVVTLIGRQVKSVELSPYKLASDVEDI